METKKKSNVTRDKKAPKQANKMKTKTDEISRWESEGGNFIPTGQLPAAQQQEPTATPPTDEARSQRKER